MKKETVHIISHSHWDREWYLPFDRHRVKLVELIDTLLMLLDDVNSGYSGFFLDGQTIVIDDYLAIRPENREKLIKYIREGRLGAGPWYVLQDEFLTGSESNIRNLITGITEAEKYGGVTKVGYFPDAFGNAGQMPQILAQAGIDAVVFGRGVQPIGPDNTISDGDAYKSVYSEMNWASPDGSSLFGILFANWYNNGAEIPTDCETAKHFWESRLGGVRRFASTGEYLLMNGCDHQPVQTDIPAAIKTARKLYPDIEFIHSDFPMYIKAVKDHLKTSLSTVTGELTSQQTDGWYTLVNTCSSRIYLKKLNRKNEMMLYNIAEPMTVAASFFGSPVPAHFLDYAWKSLMQNHPHDSICGCSSDEVNREIFARFEKSIAVTTQIIEDAIEVVADNTDTTAFSADDIPFVAFNTSGYDRTCVITTEIDIKRGNYSERSALENINIESICVKDENGKLYSCTVEDLGVKFGYELPKVKFRKPFLARRVRISFGGAYLPAMGRAVFALTRAKTANKSSLVHDKNKMENDFVIISVSPDGTFSLTDKTTGKTLAGLGILEDTGDVGNEYIYACPKNTSPIYNNLTDAEIILTEDTPFRASFKIITRMMIPESADSTLAEEIERMVEFRSRRAGRSNKTIETEITSILTLERDSRMLKINVSFDNRCSDHRLRMLFPSGFSASAHKADSIFEVVTRANKPDSAWKNPSNCHHQQCFVSINDSDIGLTVANIGLNEYEILPECNTIAVTLLRCTGEIGDWGVFPTPEAQCIGKSSLDLAVILHKGDVIESGAFTEAYAYQIPVLTRQTELHSGETVNTLINWNGTALALTAFKEAVLNKGKIIRWVNLSDKPAVLSADINFDHCDIFESNVIEECGKNLGRGHFDVTIKPFGIYTILIK
ncbi:MAG: alpha-mannosidase [Eubacteriales bacterium]